MRSPSASLDAARSPRRRARRPRRRRARRRRRAGAAWRAPSRAKRPGESLLSGAAPAAARHARRRRHNAHLANVVACARRVLHRRAAQVNALSVAYAAEYGPRRGVQRQLAFSFASRWPAHADEQVQYEKHGDGRRVGDFPCRARGRSPPSTRIFWSKPPVEELDAAVSYVAPGSAARSAARARAHGVSGRAARARHLRPVRSRRRRRRRRRAAGAQGESTSCSPRSSHAAPPSRPPPTLSTTVGDAIVRIFLFFFNNIIIRPIVDATNYKGRQLHGQGGVEFDEDDSTWDRADHAKWRDTSAAEMYCFRAADLMGCFPRGRLTDYWHEISDVRRTTCVDCIKESMIAVATSSCSPP